jgi:hypothetical protein
MSSSLPQPSLICFLLLPKLLLLTTYLLQEKTGGFAVVQRQGQRTNKRPTRQTFTTEAPIRLLGYTIQEQDDRYPLLDVGNEIPFFIQQPEPEAKGKGVLSSVPSIP